MAKNSTLNELTVQPQALEAEEAVLGSMLTTKEAVSKGMQWLTANQFYKRAHESIFSCMTDLFDKGEPIDTISVVDYLKKKKEIVIFDPSKKKISKEKFYQFFLSFV